MVICLQISFAFFTNHKKTKTVKSTRKIGNTRCLVPGKKKSLHTLVPTPLSRWARQIPPARCISGHPDPPRLPALTQQSSFTRQPDPPLPPRDSSSTEIRTNLLWALPFSSAHSSSAGHSLLRAPPPTPPHSLECVLTDPQAPLPAKSFLARTVHCKMSKSDVFLVPGPRPPPPGHPLGIFLRSLIQPLSVTRTSARRKTSTGYLLNRHYCYYYYSPQRKAERELWK